MTENERKDWELIERQSLGMLRTARRKLGMDAPVFESVPRNNEEDQQAAVVAKQIYDHVTAVDTQ